MLVEHKHLRERGVRVMVDECVSPRQYRAEV